jgi:hypothetical protein
MRDPIFSAIVAARIGLLWSDAATGKALSPWPIVQVPALPLGITFSDGELRYDRNVVKSFTPNELRDRLVHIGNSLLRTAPVEPQPAHVGSGYSI